MEIKGLGYVGLTAPDPESWVRFARDVLGLDLGRAPLHAAYESGGEDGRGPDGSAWFRVDDWSWRLAVHPTKTDSEEPGLAYLGFELGGCKDLEDALESLRAAGHPARTGTEEECVARAVSGIGYTCDPAGNAIELFYGPQIMDGYQNSRGMVFMTGELGMGHINLYVQDLPACSAFYTDVLGFRLTDFYRVGPGLTINFFHTNPRHHTIGMMNVAPINALQHVMFELSELDMVGRAYDRVMAAGCKISASLGRHSNDQIVSFYVQSPSGLDVEIGWGAMTVGPDWTPCYRAPGDVWGHHGLTAENLAEAGNAA